ncbi:MAG TPA: hypothetical protein VMW79_07770 [Anaerolineae bacterium]|nr:hypothetical protein [Anaerolineae bacterium]
MGQADIEASSKARSLECAKRDMMIDGEVAEIVRTKVLAQLDGFTSDEKDDFLAALIEHGNIATACRRVGISRMTAHAARKRDPEFAWRWAEIMEAWVDDIEAVLMRQCLDPSSANTIARFFYLKAHRGKYRDAVQNADRPQRAEVRVVVELLPPRDRPEMVMDAEVLGEPNPD